MNFVEATKTCFIKYADFSGRASRSEYWYFSLFMLLLSICSMIIDSIIAGVPFWEYDDWTGPASLIVTILTILPALGVSVRRLHDIDKSGWWILIAFTFIGFILLIHWAIKESNIGDNQFGSDPLEKINEERIAKPISKLVHFLVIFLAIIFTFLFLLGIGLEMGVFPDTKVQSGKDLASNTRAKLVSNDIILESDNIIYFYSEGFLSVIEVGQLLTEDRIVSYETTENNQLEKYQMLYKNIKTIELVEQGNFSSDSVYNIIGNENASYESLTILLSAESDGDTKFIKELESRVLVHSVAPLEQDRLNLEEKGKRVAALQLLNEEKRKLEEEKQRLKEEQEKFARLMPRGNPSAKSGGKCPQPRKTKSAPGGISKKDKTGKANLANGKKIYLKTAKPMACKMCHGDKGDGGGKLGKALKPRPRNFTCVATMKKVSAGQMFYIIKNGSKGTGMVPHKKTLKDKEIWDVVKYIRTTFVK